jgi:antitoxin VapB
MGTGIVYKNNSTQAVRLPVYAYFPDNVKKVSVRIVGHDRILTPLHNTWDSFFLQGTATTNDFMTDRASQEQQYQD